MADTPPPVPNPAISPNPDYHTKLLRGFSDSAAYDTHRPTYYPPAVSRLLSSLCLTGRQRAKVLDLGAGTGKFTELLVRREEGFEIVAVEPHEEMRRVLEKKAEEGKGGWVRVQVREGDAVGIPVKEGWADSVVIAQAFHWFSHLPALTSIHRTLSHTGPGTVGIIWNIEDYNNSPLHLCSTPWERLLQSLCLQHRDGLPRYREGTWKDVFREHEVAELFEMPFEEKIWKREWLVEGGREGLWDRLRTLSYLKNLEGKVRAKFRGDFDAIIDGAETDHSLGMVKNEKGEITVHGIVHVIWFKRYA